MIIFEQYIPDILPEYFRENDSYKDGSGKGFLIRFLEIFGQELDEQFYPNIEGVIDLHDVFNTPTAYLEYLGYLMGNLPDIIVNNEHDYRNLLSYIVSIYQIKGTIQSYKSMFFLLGSDTTINELATTTKGYDDGTSLYDLAGILYDETCVPCSDYEIILTNGPLLTADIFLKIKEIVFLLEPINAILTRINYLGDDVTESMITVTILSNGDLEYNNDADPGLILTLDGAGNLIIDGPNADRYYIDDNGDLIYILY